MPTSLEGNNPGPVASPAITAFYASVLIGFLAASSAPTPLYHLYQENWSFSAATLTFVFGIYAISLLVALLVAGSLSDYLGRRPVVFAALLLELLTMGLFLQADSVGWLLAARLLQGLATGMAISSVGAALLDCDRARGPLVNSLAPLVGMACGAFGTGLLVDFGPWPLRLVYGVLVVLFLAQAAVLWRLPETVGRQPGALASLRPTLSIPPQARAMLWRILPVDVAVWSLGGFYLSLAPSLVRAATGTTSATSGGLVVSLLTLSGAAAVYGLRDQPPLKVLRLGGAVLMAGVAGILLAVHSGLLWLFFVTTVVAGYGFGAGFLGAVRSLLPLAHAHERAGLMSTFLVLSYLAFCLPALAIGIIIRYIGLLPATDLYGALVITLAFLALLAMRFQRLPAEQRV